MKTLDKVYVVDSILRVKHELLNEDCVTRKECNRVVKLLERRLKENGHDIEFSLIFFREHKNTFIYVSSEIIIENPENKSINPLYELKSEITDKDVRRIIYDKDFIASCLYDLELEKIPVLITKRNCINCSVECIGYWPNCSCDRWKHNITIGPDGIIKK